MTSDPVVVLEMHRVRKDYHALRPLRVNDLVIRHAERVSLAGTDTPAAEVFVGLVTGAVLPDEGEVRVFGESAGVIDDHARWLELLDRFGIVGDRAPLLDAFTAAQNIAIPLTLEIDPLSPEVAARVARVAGDAGVDRSLLDVAAGSLAPDQQLRVRLARALAPEPRLLLLEHPTASIARDRVVAVARTIRRAAAARGLAVLALTEDAAFATAVADRHLRLAPATGEISEGRGWRRFFS